MKRIGYAYATSQHAKECGFYNDGCYTVEVFVPCGYIKMSTVEPVITGFESYREAFDYSNSLTKHESSWYCFTAREENHNYHLNKN